MTLKRVFVPPEQLTGDHVELQGEEFHHLVRVRRARAGSAVVVFDGCGKGYRGVVTELRNDGAVVRLDGEILPSAEPVLRICLYQALPSSRSVFEEVLSRATELGVDRLVPVLTGRTRPAPFATSAGLGSWHQRLERISRDACKSSGRFSLVRLDEPLPLDGVLRDPPGRPDLCLVSAEGGAHPTMPSMLETVPSPVASAAILIGPEGGWAVDELQQAMDGGFHPVSLGPRILRTATAAVVAVTALQLLLGDLGRLPEEG